MFALPSLLCLRQARFHGHITDIKAFRSRFSPLRLVTNSINRHSGCLNNHGSVLQVGFLAYITNLHLGSGCTGLTSESCKQTDRMHEQQDI